MDGSRDVFAEHLDALEHFDAYGGVEEARVHERVGALAVDAVDKLVEGSVQVEGGALGVGPHVAVDEVDELRRATRHRPSPGTWRGRRERVRAPAPSARRRDLFELVHDGSQGHS